MISEIEFPSALQVAPTLGDRRELGQGQAEQVDVIAKRDTTEQAVSMERGRATMNGS